MKLGALKTAIREADNVRIFISYGQPALHVVVQKASVLAELDRAFPGGRAQETGLRLHPQGNTLYPEKEVLASCEQVPDAGDEAAA